MAMTRTTLEPPVALSAGACRDQSQGEESDRIENDNALIKPASSPTDGTANDTAMTISNTSEMAGQMVLHASNSALALGPTIFPTKVANIVTALATSARLSLRVTAFFIEAILETSQNSTRFGLGLTRRLLIGAVSSARRVYITASGDDPEKIDVQTDAFLNVLDRWTNVGIYVIHHTFTLAELFTMSGFYLTASTVQSASFAAHESVTLFDSLFGSNESSRALSSIIALVRQELLEDERFQAADRGKVAGLTALTKALTAFACLQNATWAQSSKRLKMRVLYDCTVVVSDDRSYKSEASDQYRSALPEGGPGPRAITGRREREREIPALLYEEDDEGDVKMEDVSDRPSRHPSMPSRQEEDEEMFRQLEEFVGDESDSLSPPPSPTPPATRARSNSQPHRHLKRMRGDVYEITDELQESTVVTRTLERVDTRPSLKRAQSETAADVLVEEVDDEEYSRPHPSAPLTTPTGVDVEDPAEWIEVDQLLDGDERAMVPSSPNGRPASVSAEPPNAEKIQLVLRTMTNKLLQRKRTVRRVQNVGLSPRISASPSPPPSTRRRGKEREMSPPPSRDFIERPDVRQVDWREAAAASRARVNGIPRPHRSNSYEPSPSGRSSSDSGAATASSSSSKPKRRFFSGYSTRGHNDQSPRRTESSSGLSKAFRAPLRRKSTTPFPLSENDEPPTPPSSQHALKVPAAPKVTAAPLRPSTPPTSSTPRAPATPTTPGVSASATPRAPATPSTPRAATNPRPSTPRAVPRRTTPALAPSPLTPMRGEREHSVRQSVRTRSNAIHTSSSQIFGPDIESSASLFPHEGLIRNIHRFMRYSSAAYGQNFLRILGLGNTDFQYTSAGGHHANSWAFARHTNIPINNLILSSYSENSPLSGHKAPPLVHYIAVEHDLRAIVLTCRGTLGLNDVLVDLTCQYRPISIEGVEGDFQVHAGMHESALQLTSRASTVHRCLVEALEQYPDYGLVLCGHSLGGGVAALLGIEWAVRSSVFATQNAHAAKKVRHPALRTKFVTSARSGLPPGRPLHVYTYGVPAVASHDLSRYCDGLVTSVIQNSDVVPTLSLGVLRDLKNIAVTLYEETGVAEEIVGRVLGLNRKKFAFPDSDTEMGPPSGPEEEQMLSDWMESLIKTMRADMDNDKLYPPGSVYIMEYSDVFLTANQSSPDGGEQSNQRARRVILRLCESVKERFGELTFAKSMLKDHMPLHYERATELLIQGVQE